MEGSLVLVTEQPGRTEVHTGGYRVTVGRDRRSSRLLITETNAMRCTIRCHLT